MRSERWFGAIVVMAFIFCSSATFAAKSSASQPAAGPPETPSLTLSEETRSLSDCMTFAASHKSKGVEADKAEFRRQFGDPIGGVGTTTEYTYDKYTKVILECAKASCSPRCLQK